MKWINIDSANIQKLTENKSSGRTTYLSLFDIPVSAGVGVEGHVLVLKFNYMGGTERTERVEVKEGVIFHIGRSSHRLYSVEADISHLLPEPADTIEEGIDSFLSRQEVKNSPIGSYKAARYVLDSGTLQLNQAAGLHLR